MQARKLVITNQLTVRQSDLRESFSRNRTDDLVISDR